MPYAPSVLTWLEENLGRLQRHGCLLFLSLSLAAAVSWAALQARVAPPRRRVRRTTAAMLCCAALESIFTGAEHRRLFGGGVVRGIVFGPRLRGSASGGGLLCNAPSATVPPLGEAVQRAKQWDRGAWADEPKHEPAHRHQRMSITVLERGCARGSGVKRQ